MAGPYAFFDRVRETTNTTGTGAITLAGAASGYQSFASVFANGDKFYYTIADQAGSNFEDGEGTYVSASNTFTRDTVRSSSNGGALVNFGSGTKDVRATCPSYFLNRMTFSLFDHYADAGSVGTGETDLYTDTLNASVFAANGDKVNAEYGCTFANSVSTKRLRLYFAGTAIFDTGALTISASSEISLYASIIRDSATTVRYMISASTTGASTGSYSAVGKLTGLTLAGNNVLKITGTAAGAGAADNDVLAVLGCGFRCPAA